MNKKINKVYKFQSVKRALLFAVLASLVIVTPFARVQAVDLAQRRIILASSQPGISTSHTIEYINSASVAFGSIKIEYCSNSPLFSEPCVAPVGFNLSSATLASQSGNVGFVKDALSTVSTLILSRPISASTSSPNSYTISGVINPSELDKSFYARISLFSSLDATGIAFDQGAVAFSTSGRFSIGAYVPPFLTFCVGVIVSSDCSLSTGSIVSLGELSESNANSSTSQFASATNDESGHNIFINGQTMTSGNNIIPALSSVSASSAGNSQFGVNLRANSSPSVGANPSGVGSTTASGDYNITNQYKFNNGDVIASSNLPTDFKVFTVSYVVNISKDQPAGNYAATLLYTAVASF